MPDTIKIGTRGSQLALWQANHIADLLREAYPNIQTEIVTFTTKGDKILDQALPAIGGKGLFTEELERALLAGEIDCAVHSLKDLPTEQPEGLTIGAVPKRAAVHDVLVSKRHLKLDHLPEGAKIGTSSLRRAAQLRHYRSDLEILDIRGNVPTRINKALDPDGEYDAIVLAQAGVERLSLMDTVTQVLSLDIMLPAPGQGAIGVQCRSTVNDVSRFWPLNDSETRPQVFAERGFLSKLEGGCSVPVAAYATEEFDGQAFTLKGRVVSVDGQHDIQASGIWKVPIVMGFNILSSLCGADEEAMQYGFDLAEQAIEQGAGKILAEVKHDLAR